MDTWISAIRRAIEITLAKQQQQRPSMSKTTGLHDPEVNRLLELNPTCADCGAEKPDWVSINLGVLVCIGCSGIHRSLGSHISKVRSLTLDQLPRSQIRVLLRLGNVSVNRILEATLHPERKPTADASRDERSNFIQAKYIDRKFLDPTSRNDVLNRSDGFAFAQLIDSARSDNLENLARLILSSCPIDASVDGETALHAASLAGHEDCVELLLLNGANPAAVSSQGYTPLQLAQEGGHADVIVLLERILKTRMRPGSLHLSPTSAGAANSQSSRVARGVAGPSVDTTLGGDYSDSDDIPSLLDPTTVPHHRPTRSAPSSPVYKLNEDEVDLLGGISRPLLPTVEGLHQLSFSSGIHDNLHLNPESIPSPDSNNSNTSI